MTVQSSLELEESAGFPTREEWLAYVEEPVPTRPVLPDPDAFERMTDDDRRALNRRRKKYHRQLGETILLETASHREIHEEIAELMETNHAARGARRAYAISGEPMLGKSTVLATFAKKFELAVRRNFPTGCTSSGDEIVPVVWCSLTGGVTIKDVNVLINDFYGNPTSGTMTELTLRIQKTARRCRTRLFVIDDIHHLDTRYQGRNQVVDHFKVLLNTVPATFVFAGVEADRGALLGGTSGASSRAVRKRTIFSWLEPESIKEADDRANWGRLLNAISQHLVLAQAEPGDLTTRLVPETGLKMFRHLHKRTGGEIGVLVDLLRKAANRAINDQSERITGELLDMVKISGKSQPRPRVVVPLRS